MKILIDMNLSPDWVKTFSEAGIESVHWSTTGDICANDRVTMDSALTNDFIVFTHDLDFGALLAATQAESPSVIQVRIENLLPDAIATMVISALSQFRTELETGALVSIDVLRSRVRILPIEKP